MHISCTGRRTFCSAPTMPFSLLKYCAPPTPREVHFWYLVPEEVQGKMLFNAYKDLISPEEHTYVFQMKEKQLQRQALLARVLVRTSLARYTDGKINPKSLKFRKNSFGKPEVIWPFEKHNVNEWKPPPLCFNLAHTSSLIACGVTTKSSVGIDVEEKGRRMSNNILKFARRYFSLSEIAWLEGFPDPERQRQKFVQLWTLKEAYVKALGRGISGAPLKDFTIHLKNLSGIQEDLCQCGDAASHSLAQKITLEVSRNSDAITTNWQFLLFQPTDLHYASVCMEQNENHLHEEGRDGISCSGIKMRIWRTVPLVKDESLSGKQAILACSNPVRF